MIKLIRKFLAFIFKLKIKKKCKSYIERLRVNGYSTCTNKTILGKNVNFNGMKIAGCGNVTIGDNFHSGSECQIITEIHNYEGIKIPYDETYICKDIIIEDNVWIGNRVMILGSVTIGEGAIIQAGSVVIKDIPKYAIAGGHPAKVFSQRDVEHYNILKNKRAFL